MKINIEQIPEERKTLPTRGLVNSTAIWMKEKAVRDNEIWNGGNPQTSNYWIVENKCYDLSKFAKIHPGGSSWIELTKGQDISEHFVIHHLDEEKAREELKKYYVKDCAKNVSRFTFQPDGFYRAVKRRVLSKFSKAQLQNSTPSKYIGITFISIWFALLFATAFTGSYIYATLCSLLMIGVLGIGHNFVHHKQNMFKYALLLTGFTHNQWQIMHCLSHHIYPNLQLDFQIQTLEPIVYYLRSRPTNGRFIEIAVHIIFILLQPLLMLTKIVVVPLTKCTMPDFLFGFPLLALGLFYWFNGGHFWPAFFLYLYIYALEGFVFMKILFCGHRVQEVWTEGAQKIDDFGQHTFYASNDTDARYNGVLSFLLFAGFNNHISHHFFPTADHSKLQPLMDIIIQVANQRGMTYKSQNRLQCLKSISKGLVGRIPFTTK